MSVSGIALRLRPRDLSRGLVRMALTADQIGLLSRLLDQALPLDTEARRQWLESLPPEHQTLLPALRQALLFDDDATSTSALFKTDPGSGGAPGASTVLTSGLQPGQRIGPYQLVRELGAGGMAVVWLAQRADGAFRGSATSWPSSSTRISRGCTTPASRPTVCLTWRWNSWRGGP